jgi:hypothetical protein
VLKATGLSLEQAPPVHLPLRFFLTAPLFAVAAGLTLAWQGEAVLASRWTPAALATVHLIAIGFLSQVMCGALLQMLPVIAGSPFPAVRRAGTAVHALLSLGTALLAWGFFGDDSLPLLAGAGCTAAGFALFLVPLGLALSRAQGVPDTVRAMRLSAVALIVTLLLGFLLIAALRGWLPLPALTHWVDLHLTWGLVGWAGLLILGVAYRVVPMFHVTPSYPRWLARLLAPGLVLSLATGSLLLAAGWDAVAWLAFAFAAAGFTLFALVTVRLQVRRKRPRLDATLMHWWAAMASVAAAASTWLLQGAPELVGVFLLVGVGIGLPSGMLFKIVPFLSWFHLQHRQIASGRLDVPIPHMHSFISERDARLHFSAHLLAVCLLVASFVEPQLARPGGVALTLSALSLEWAILRAARIQWRLAGELA